MDNFQKAPASTEDMLNIQQTAIPVDNMEPIKQEEEDTSKFKTMAKKYLSKLKEHNTKIMSAIGTFCTEMTTKLRTKFENRRSSEVETI